MRDYNRIITGFAFDPANSMIKLNQVQFDAAFDQFLLAKKIPLDAVKKWAQDFETFLHENRTFPLDAERNRIMRRFIYEK